MKKIQFICKKNELYSFVSYCRRSSGLYNSTRFIVESLNKHPDIEAEIIEVNDNNDIDREVTRFKPDIVIIEALWVVPEKFAILSKLHPNVKWFIHLHSHIPFLALEGIAMGWLMEYAREGHVGLIANSPESYEALRPILCEDILTYLPNVYLSQPRRAILPSKHSDTLNNTINIGCFGAIRPLKNQLLQALAAIQFAKEIGKNLNFWVNASRIETGGQPILKNLQQLFDIAGHHLIELHWCEPEEFLDLLQNHMDIGMQVSLTETFNVVNADYVTAGVPSVVSKEITWASHWNRAADNSLDSMVKALHLVYNNRLLVKWNQHLLLCHSRDAQLKWFNFVTNV